MNFINTLYPLANDYTDDINLNDKSNRAEKCMLA